MASGVYHVRTNFDLGVFQEKIPGRGGVGTPSIIWDATTKILIFGVPPHKYKYRYFFLENP
jgi:hypothetical protein